jgi:uncharacterized membrane protein YphA (DoxX/SURF4 family)
MPFARWTRFALATGAVLGPTAALAHEAWLLTPDELAALATAPVPHLFRDPPALGFAALAATLVATLALLAAERLAPLERRLAVPLVARASGLGPLAIRAGLAAMLGLGALGALPRHGTAMLAQPTLFVPDMQLSLAAGLDRDWAWLAAPELALALLLAVGLATRLAALGVIALAIAGLVAFGPVFAFYAPHFVAPALLLLAFGGGTAALDRLLPVATYVSLPTGLAWRLALALAGGTFVWLGVAWKLSQPTLLIAILTHGQVPLFGLPVEVAALVMTLVEITAGALIAMGRLVRPLALVLIGAFSFFAVTLGETLVFHANLYGLMAMLVLAGDTAPRPEPPDGPSRRLFPRPAGWYRLARRRLVLRPLRGPA